MTFSTRIRSGFAWTTGSRILSQFVAWAVTIFVIRILSPTDYGLLAMATVLISFLGLFSELGLGSAIVQAGEHDVQTLRKIYGIVLLVHGSIFAILYVIAPFVASYFSEERLTFLIRVMGLHFLIIAQGVIPNAMLQRDLEFKNRSILGLVVNVIQGVATLGLAFAGFGVWSLVLGSLLQVALQTLGLNILQPFLLKPSFAFKGLRGLFAFGGYVSSSRFIWYLYTQADIIIGGRLLGKEQIGYYSVGLNLASLPMQRISAILNEVAFPAFAHLRAEPAQVAHHALQAVRLVSFIAFPIFWGISAIAREIVEVLIGPNWEPAILPLQLLAIVMPLRMIGQLMPPTLHGLGKANLECYNQLIICVAMILAFMVGVRWGIVGLSIAWVVVFPLTLLENLRRWLPVIGLRTSQLMGVILRPAAAGGGMFAVVFAFREMGLSHGLVGLMMLIFVGVVSYAALSMLLNRDGLNQVVTLFRSAPSPANSSGLK